MFSTWRTSIACLALAAVTAVSGLSARAAVCPPVVHIPHCAAERLVKTDLPEFPSEEAPVPARLALAAVLPPRTDVAELAVPKILRPAAEETVQAPHAWREPFLSHALTLRDP